MRLNVMNGSKASKAVDLSINIGFEPVLRMFKWVMLNINYDCYLARLSCAHKVVASW